MAIERKAGEFLSFNGSTRIAYRVYSPGEAPPLCAVQIVHGMAEHFGRYGEFARFLAQRGIAVYGHDHVGHGDSAPAPRDLGFMGEKDGAKVMVEDVHRLNRIIHQEHPYAPIVLLGHSMGSLIARVYLTLYSQAVDAAILSGTAGPNHAVGLGIWLSEIVSLTRGKRHRSALLNKISTGNYAKHIQHPKSEMDWLSRDMACVEEYLRDPRCGYRFTARGYHDLFVLLRECNRKGWAQAIRRDLPVYLFSGDEDPVGNYGKGVLAVRDAMRESGMHDVRCKLYRGGRHEMLNEINKAEVYEDIWEFLKDTVLQEEEEECSPV